MKKVWWCEMDVSSNYTIAIHEPGTLRGSEELRDKIVIRVCNVAEGKAWLIPIGPGHAERIGKILSSLSFLQISEGHW